MLVREFGGTDSPAFKENVDSSWTKLKAPIEKKIILNDVAAMSAMRKACIPEQAALFDSFSSSTRNTRRWAQATAINVITSDLPAEQTMATVEVNLQSLTRDFGAYIAISQLFGKDFLDRYPALLEDFWKFDNDLFPLLVTGIPSWAPFKTIKYGMAARTRPIHELEALNRRIIQYQHGQPVEFDADMSDISEAALDRSKIYKRDGWSFTERAAADLAILWGQNANTQPVLFWFLAYVFSTPACVFETYLMVNEPTSIRLATRFVTVSDGDLKHELKPGMFISVPHSLINHDLSRFLHPDPDSGKLLARYGKLKPWSSGVGMCKGRPWAEKETLCLGAAIISLWDIEPTNGTWKLPAMMPGTAVKKPVEDIPVLIKRRTW
ncbi:putative cholesterol 7-alpha-monooxygenase [Clathrospora elynae]|uniref:Putative cholesterol 7-alpha-monooxygenase n=1 Tax=Clathrospora elynae TaxID=706981 RepID=A0A6A5SYH3_9PLEO|nr:putative cholesterol 7-alpha-monooxygenase [Clathrospora elynae]